ncbi:MAG: rRNA maturation RNase YbeY [Terriglobales bacterium]
MVIFRKPIAGASERALARFVGRAQRAAGLHGRVDVVVTSSRELRDLNRRFRRQDHATDVLSFPSGCHTLCEEKGGDFVGDIAISAEIAAENARRLGHPAADELKILALHGLLHLAGYDHERDRGEMAHKESRLRRMLRLPDTLIARANGRMRCKDASASADATKIPRHARARRGEEVVGRARFNDRAPEARYEGQPARHVAGGGARATSEEQSARRRRYQGRPR